MEIITKRIYEPVSSNDGVRVLVDRLWPRGVKKDDARIVFSVKDIAPSTELRKWYRHDHEKWQTFRKRYWSELNAQPSKKLYELNG